MNFSEAHFAFLSLESLDSFGAVQTSTKNTPRVEIKISTQPDRGGSDVFGVLKDAGRYREVLRLRVLGCKQRAKKSIRVTR